MFSTSQQIGFNVETEIKDFVFEIDTSKTSSGSTTNKQFKLPLTNLGKYNFHITWGDGGADKIISDLAPAATHTYASTGTYTVRIKGKCEGWKFNNTGDRLKMKTISQWGCLELGVNLTGHFFGCAYMRITATDKPNLSRVTSMADCFRSCSAMATTEIFSGWDVRSVRNFDRCFASCTYLNCSVNDWKFTEDPTASITAVEMFNGCVYFNQTINWDTSNFTNMSYMFQNCYVFNQLVAFNTARVTNFFRMFAGARVFNQNLNWNTSAATNMSYMFNNAIAFNGDISDWDVSNVTDFSYMFFDAHDFAGDLSDWDVSSATSMRYMFALAHNFNSDISLWDTSAVTDMGNMFQEALLFNQDIGDWDTSSVGSMTGMFNSGIFNQDISAWDVSSCDTFSYMFAWNTSFNQPIGSWDVSNGNDFSGMFSGASAFNQNIGSWDVSHAYYLSSMFDSATAFNQTLNWDLANCEQIAYMFAYATSFTGGGVAGWTNTNWIFYADYAFEEATAFNASLGAWEIDSFLSGWSMFLNSGISDANWDATLNGWSAYSTKQQYTVVEAQGASHTSAADAAITNLVDNFYWFIVDDTGEHGTPGYL